ncbi:uncharacterized protein LOC133523501 [Cydia pomonella]|uniref:uncharacterized protein LOC133523501 n=1 Tax=Cydia pomonella TaxID=82600 RepID=UPI002ADD6841|nr:uncharacterized protein LOC133523501 [Cydia pomonella]
MWVYSILLIALSLHVTCQESQDPILYYYGIDESERSLPLCGAGAACAAVLRRYWRPAALLRLCRCARRARCDALLPPARRLPLNNRAHFQFCKPITDWPDCSIDDVPLTVQSPYARIDPEEIENLHHKNIQLAPPKITFKCRCRHPTYWKLISTVENEDISQYRCAALPSCKTGELCGHVTGDLFALYQSCTCPKHHICVQGGGLPEISMSELLYRGKGWRAHCERISDDYSYEDY